MKVRELMTTNVSTAAPNTPIDQVAKQMRDLDVGCIPVCDQDKNALGIITDRDIVIRSVSEGNMNANAGEVMTSDPVYATPEMHAHEAAEIMAKHKIRRLPVVENGRIVGILAIGDLATVNIYINEAGDALSNISKPSAPKM